MVTVQSLTVMDRFQLILSVESIRYLSGAIETDEAAITDGIGGIPAEISVRQRACRSPFGAQYNHRRPRPYR